VTDGGRVVLTGRRVRSAEEVAEPLGDKALVAVGDAAATPDARRVIRAAVDSFGGLDVVVANAGGRHLGAAADTDDIAWRDSIHANLDSAFVTIRESSGT
jgi:NAD(P)-dependent dehydrogenase (short-subunit alcohol dehydrogenase family)